MRCDDEDHSEGVEDSQAVKGEGQGIEEMRGATVSPASGGGEFPLSMVES